METTFIPLHPAQRDVYLDQLIHKDSPQYNIGGYIELKGSLDINNFREVVQSTAGLFDAFKLRFDHPSTAPACYIDHQFKKPALELLDFTEHDQPRAAALEWMQARFNLPIDIQAATPPFEEFLLKITDTAHYFFGKYHHLITDGYGFIVLVDYLSAAYRSLQNNTPVEFNYPSYTAEMKEAAGYFSSLAYREDAAYWKARLAEKPAKLITPKYLPTATKGVSGTFVLEITPVQQQVLLQLQQNTRAGIQQLTIAALLVYFGKTTGTTELVVGTPVHRRGSRQLRKMIGMLSGVLVFKGQYQPGKPLLELIKEIAGTQKSDYRHQHFPVADLGRMLKSVAADGYIYQLSVDYEPLNFQPDFGEGLSAVVRRISTNFESNPLQLCWLDYGKEQPLKLQVHYGKAYFDATEIDLFARRLLFMLEQFAAGLSKPSGEINILPPWEKALLDQWNNTRLPLPENSTLVALFEERVATCPNNTAMVFEERRISYRELNERANQLSRHLVKNGIQPNALVPLYIQRSVEMVVAILGVIKAGAAYVPVEPGYPDERICFILEDTAATLVLTSADLVTKLASCTRLPLLAIDTDWPAISVEPVTDMGMAIQPGHLAYIIYTSGSTGKPKGVMIEHGSVVNLVTAQSRNFGITETERILQFSNYAFDAAVEQIFLALLNGATLYQFREGLQFNLEAFDQFLKSNGITHLHATPAFLEQLHFMAVGDLKRMIAGGDVCKKELAALWKNKLNFFNEYGPTETTVTTLCYQDDANRRVSTYSLPVGKPLGNTRAYITGPDGGLLPVGAPGLLHIAGAGVAKGYLNREALTAEKFVIDPFSSDPTQRMYNTGDLARWLPDGNIDFLGRIDDQVKIRGFRIELGEIENVLLELEMVKQAIVLAKKDAHGQNNLVAYILPNGDFNKDAIQAGLKKKLPGYMVPATWVPVTHIPLTGNGKIDRKALPDPGKPEWRSNAFVAPDGPLETELAAIWKEVLGLELIGVTDNFFELGGHSLTAIQLTSRLHQQYNIKIDIGAIFSQPTIRQLTEVIKNESKELFINIPSLPRQEYYPLSNAQQRFWILSHFKDGSEAYNVASAFVLEGALNLPAFQKAFEIVIERHEILRTVFVEVDGEPKQKVLPATASGFAIAAVEGVTSTDVIKHWLDDDTRKPFDLATGPLMRATLFLEAPQRFVLLFNIHHIISDGWSKAILVREVLQAYQAIVTGVPIQLPALPIQYRDYAAWQEGAFEKQGDFWRGLYQHGVPRLNFPVDIERPKVLSFFGALLRYRIPETLTTALRQCAVSANLSLNNLLFSLYGLLAARWSGQQQLVVGSLSSGRSHIDLENLVGVFINFLPVKLSPRPDMMMADYLEESNQALVQAYNHQDYPFDRMVEACIRNRDASRNPFFDTMVNFHLQHGMGGEAGSMDYLLTDTGIRINPYTDLQEDLFQSVLDFKLDIEPAGNALDCYLSYNSKLFFPETMQAFLQQLIELFEMVSTDPGKTLQEYGAWADAAQTGEEAQQEDTTGATPELPVNICASFVMEPMEEFIRYWSNEFDLDTVINFAPYNQVFQQLVNPQSLLNTAGGINVLMIRLQDWLRDKSAATVAQQLAFLTATYDEFTTALQQLGNTNRTPLLLGIVPVMEVPNIPAEVVAKLKGHHQHLVQLVTPISRFHLLDMEEIAALYNVATIFDTKADELGHMPFSQEYYAALGTYIARKVTAFKGPGYKVIALDADNTLWKGVCGELGALGVTIDDNFTFLQEFMLQKYQEGFLLVLCSKNNEADVWEVFETHPGMKLQKQHIAAHRINWQPKSGNLLSIAAELNLGIDSFIFLDDSEYEIAEVSQACPEVYAIPLPDPGEEAFEPFLQHIWAFDTFRVTEEDTKRNQQYQLEKQRKEEQGKYGTLEDFLATLEIKVTISPLTTSELERAVQLSLRTNQFNLNGIRKSPAEIAASMQQENTINWIIDVKDRFGEYGIVGLVLAKIENDTMQVNSFLLSCRVLGRNVEDVILAELQKYGESKGLAAINASFQLTEKNKPFHDFLKRTNWVTDPVSNTYKRFLKITEQIIA